MPRIDKALSRTPQEVVNLSKVTADKEFATLNKNTEPVITPGYVIARMKLYFGNSINFKANVPGE